MPEGWITVEIIDAEKRSGTKGEYLVMQLDIGGGNMIKAVVSHWKSYMFPKLVASVGERIKMNVTMKETDSGQIHYVQAVAGVKKPDSSREPAEETGNGNGHEKPADTPPANPPVGRQEELPGTPPAKPAPGGKKVESQEHIWSMAYSSEDRFIMVFGHVMNGWVNGCIPGITFNQAMQNAFDCFQKGTLNFDWIHQASGSTTVPVPDKATR